MFGDYDTHFKYVLEMNDPGQDQPLLLSYSLILSPWFLSTFFETIAATLLTYKYIYQPCHELKESSLWQI